ncbi:hypothetical protein [[Limnothrix rosea] IAM M-220]|uniref:hypothetical protein n=1 Tax=[Limnothrix rosea] IAM M-220 TaxID=454133 RepID=UPI0015C58249|nr:hypothetical protein [[Limnothrix rosea] IAM M-220]
MVVCWQTKSPHSLSPFAASSFRTFLQPNSGYLEINGEAIASFFVPYLMAICD